MTSALVTYAQAKAHLRLPDDHEQTDVEQKTQQATAFVLRYVGREENEWTVDTDPNSDLDFSIVQGAILALLGEYWRYREPDQAEPDSADPMAGAFLRTNLRQRLQLLRRPSLA